MTDIVDKTTRSRMMSLIKTRDTRIEMVVRRLLHAAGYRYRLNVRTLPGKPDVVLPKYDAVIFVHGCFWHGHACPLYSVPSTRTDFWLAKIGVNRDRDDRAQEQLVQMGWRVLTVWECTMRGSGRLPMDVLLGSILGWLQGGETTASIEGNSD